MNPTPKPASASSRIRLVTTAERPPTPLRLAGLSPAETMAPGEYTCHCADSILRRSKNQVTNEFVIVDGEHSGTALRQWINGVTGAIGPLTRYAKECAAALGRELTSADDLDPTRVFKGKTFIVQVGWRMSRDPGGGPNSDEYALRRKDSRDFLRVLRIVREVSL
jgi:hypothetical protein